MLEALALVSRYQRDEEIYPQEGSVECWYRVISGAARRFALRADGRRQTVDLLLPGDFFGFGVHGTHAFTAEAIAADTAIERYPVSRLERLAACDPRAARELSGIISDGMSRLHSLVLILGRTTAEDVRDPSSHQVIVERGTLLEEPQVEAIKAAGVQELRIRSVLTCETTGGVCAKCYGRDLARGTPVNMGEAVGVIAAQSIGEPGTQLTMRTFHIGGAAQISEQSVIESNFEGKIKIKNKNVVKNSDGQTVAMARNMVIAVLDPDGTERAVHRIQYGARLVVDDGDKIRRGQRIAEWEP